MLLEHALEILQKLDLLFLSKQELLAQTMNDWYQVEYQA